MNFDLNIGNYSKEELEEILELPTNYDENIIQMKETKLRHNIMGDISIPSQIKAKTLGFIDFNMLLTHFIFSNFSKHLVECISMCCLYQILVSRAS